MRRTVTPDGSPTGTITPRETRPFSDNSDHPTVEALAIAWSQEVQIVGSDGSTYPTRRYGVTEQFFDVFGPRMELGRGFERGERPGPIVIAYSIWRDVFGSDPDIVGKLIGAEGGTRQVVGVTPADFAFPEDPGYWYVMRLGPAYDRSRVYRAYVRLRPGQTRDQFQAALDDLSSELGPDPSTSRPVVFVAQPFLEYVVGDLRSTVTTLFGATAILLLIACINVTNLLAVARDRQCQGGSATRGAGGRSMADPASSPDRKPPVGVPWRCARIGRRSRRRPTAAADRSRRSPEAGYRPDRQYRPCLHLGCHGPNRRTHRTGARMAPRLQPAQ